MYVEMSIKSVKADASEEVKEVQSLKSMCFGETINWIYHSGHGNSRKVHT